MKKINVVSLKTADSKASVKRELTEDQLKVVSGAGPLRDTVANPSTPVAGTNLR